MAVVQVAILTVSDRSARGERADLSGPALTERIRALGWMLVEQAVVPDERVQISRKLVEWSASGAVDLILTSGGTGFAPRDVTPEATLDVVEKQAPGLAELMRAESLKKTAHAALSRAVAGIRRRTLIINLPGSPKAALENLEFIAQVIPHAVDLLKDDPGAEAGHRPKG